MGTAETSTPTWDQVEALYALNMDIFTMDYRGYGKSEGQASHDGVIADGRAAVELVMEQEGMASEELGYVGLSLGGFVATHVSLDLPPGALITHGHVRGCGELLRL